MAQKFSGPPKNDIKLRLDFGADPKVFVK